MSENSEENSDISSDPADEIVTVGEYLAEYDSLQETAQCVFGDIDDDTCTYEKNYMNRQPLYSCLTCAEKLSTGPAGICLGCSLHCHEGHECVELYTKRNFRCDCGNSKFGDDFKCSLFPAKDEVNELNKYNQNFTGAYCTCHRPYPDPDEENSNPDEMFQCIVCEDWLHQGHAGIPDDHEFEEFVCSDCTEKLPFLIPYASDDGKNSDDTQSKIEKTGSSSEIDPKEDIICIRPSLKSQFNECSKKIPLFFQINWRNGLCRCKNCMIIYKELGCLFLLDENDTLYAYEERAKAKHRVQSSSGVMSTLEKRDPLVKALNKMDRVQKIEMIHAYNTMTTELAGYLEKFATSGKVVRDKDIYDFFDELKAKKRMRLNDYDVNTKNYDY